MDDAAAATAAPETDEQKAARLAAEKTAADAAKAEAKAKKDAEKLAAKQAREQAAADKKAAKDAEKAAKAQAAEADKAAKAKAKEDAKAAAEAAKVSSKQPEQNGVRRPKPETICGKAWAIFDDTSRRNGSPASITETLPLGTSANINDATMRTQYAHWRKFHGVSGRIDAPKPVQAPAAEPAPTA